MDPLLNLYVTIDRVVLSCFMLIGSRRAYTQKRASSVQSHLSTFLKHWTS